MQCSITWRAAGPCRVCGCQLNGPGADMRAAHLTDDGVVCAEHCAVCRQPSICKCGHHEKNHITTIGRPVHCDECDCPGFSPRDHDWSGEPVTVQGDQVELFA